MLFDTDVLIWAFRGNEPAARLIEGAEARAVSIVTYMELVQGARSKLEVRNIRSFLADFAFETLPLTENIGHRAAIYMEEYTLKTGMSMADALIAATAVEHGLMLCTANQKHYKPVSDVQIKLLSV